MSDAAISVFVFAIYLLVTGIGFIFIPNVLLPLFKFQKTNEHWIRVLGVVIAAIGFYYFIAAQNELTVFFWATIVTGSAVCICFLFLVVTKITRNAGCFWFNRTGRCHMDITGILI